MGTVLYMIVVMVVVSVVVIVDDVAAFCVAVVLVAPLSMSLSSLSFRDYRIFPLSAFGGTPPTHVLPAGPKSEQLPVRTGEADVAP